MGLRATTARAVIRWTAQQHVPIGGAYNVYSSARNGVAVDFSQPINIDPIPAWPADLLAYKVGFGLGEFGEGIFGTGHGGVPFGSGAFGSGAFGIDAEIIEFVTDPLEDGTYIFAVCPIDDAGNENQTSPATATITIAGVPDAPTAPLITAFDTTTGTATVAWTDNQNIID